MQCGDVTMPAPVVPLTKWERERAAFVRMHPDLLRTHEGLFVVIHEGRVVAQGADEAESLSRARAALGQVEMLVERVTPGGPPRYVKMPSVKVVRD